MSQPKTTSQKPNPPSTAEKNLSLWMYLPRSTPSMSETATFTLPAGELRTDSRTAAWSSTCFSDLVMRGLLPGGTDVGAKPAGRILGEFPMQHARKEILHPSDQVRMAALVRHAGHEIELHRDIVA